MELTEEIKKFYEHEGEEEIDTPRETPVVPIVLIVAIITIALGIPLAHRYLPQRLFALSVPTPTPFLQPTATYTPQATPTSEVLGTEQSATATPTRRPIRLPTLPPLPTIAIQPVVIPTSIPQPTSAPVLNCAGTARDENSQVYINPRTLSVGSSSTVSVELRDCNNNLAADDWMSVDLVSNSPTAKINGHAFPLRIQATSGRVTFSVTAQEAGTVTFKLTNINQNFLVTEPGYKTPYINFTGSSATATPNPTATTNPTPTITPTPS